MTAPELAQQELEKNIDLNLGRVSFFQSALPNMNTFRVPLLV